MKLPFVVLPGRVYAQLLADRADARADLEHERARFDAQLAQERARIDKLTETVTRMKLAGGVVQALANGGPEAKRLEPRERTRFEAAVDENERAKADPRLRAHMLRWADDEMAKARRAHARGLLDKELDAVEEDIEDRLLHWNRVTGHDDEQEDAL